jgi:hypothetical protein
MYKYAINILLVRNVLVFMYENVCVLAYGFRRLHGLQCSTVTKHEDEMCSNHKSCM